MSHTPVLLKEVITALAPGQGEFFIDGTAGSGGHAEAVLNKIGPKGKLLLIDWDQKNIEKLEEKFQKNTNIILVKENYGNLLGLMHKMNFPQADGLLLDLGFSSEQIGDGRGFSFMAGGEPLIMTYSNEAKPLRQFLRETNIKELTEIISKFGEERYARRIAEAIIKNRHHIETSGELSELIRQAVPKSYERGRIHPATRTFQAFRIYLNQELDNLKKILNYLTEILKPGGRVAVISFHSLEDRIVKNYFRELSQKGRLKIMNKKPIIASPEEIAENPRSRSAKLRAATII